MTNEEATELLGALGPDDDMSAMSLLPKQPDILDLSKPKKGKGARIQKLVADLTASASHFTNNTKDADKRKPAPIKEVYNPDKVAGPSGGRLEARKAIARMRLEEDEKAKLQYEEGFVLPKHKQLPLDDVDDILSKTVKNTSDEYWKDLNTPVQARDSYTVEHSNASSDAMDDDQSDDYEDISINHESVRRRDTILLYPSRLSRAFEHEGGATPQLYLHNPNTSVLYTLPTDTEATAEPDDGTASLQRLLLPYKRAVISLEQEFKFMLRKVNINYEGIAAYRDSVWRKFQRVNEILTSIMSHVRGVEDRMLTIELCDAFRPMLKKHQNTPAPVNEPCDDDTFTQMQEDIKDLRKWSDYYATLLSETDPVTGDDIDIVGSLKETVEQTVASLNRVWSVTEKNFKEVAEASQHLSQRMSESHEDMNDLRSRIVALEDPVSPTGITDGSWSDLLARVKALEDTPPTVHTEDVTLCDRVTKIDSKLFDIMVSIEHHKARMIDLDHISKTSQSSMDAYRANVSQVRSAVKELIDEQRTIGAHIFGLQSSNVKYSDAYESSESIVSRLAQVEETCQALKRTTTDVSIDPVVLNRLSAMEIQLGVVQKATDTTVSTRLAGLEQQLTDLLAKQADTNAAFQAHVAKLEMQLAENRRRGQMDVPNVYATDRGIYSVFPPGYFTPSTFADSRNPPPPPQPPAPSTTSATSSAQYIMVGSNQYELPPPTADPLFARSFNDKQAITIMNTAYLEDRDNPQRKSSCYDMSGHKFNLKVDESLKFDPLKLADLPVTLGLALSKYDLSGMLNETEYIVWDSKYSPADMDYVLKVHRSRLHLIFLVLQILVGRTEDTSKRTTYSQILLGYGSTQGDRASGIAALRLLKDEVYGTTYGDRAIALKNLQVFRQDLDTSRRMDNRTYYTHKKELIATCANFNMTADEIYRVMFLDGMSAEHSFCYRNILSASTIPTVDEMFSSMEVNQSALNQSVVHGTSRLMQIVPASTVVTQSPIKGHALYTMQAPTYAQLANSTHDSSAAPPPPNVSSSTPCPYHLQLKGHKLCGTVHKNGVCFLVTTAEKKGIDLQSYIREMQATIAAGGQDRQSSPTPRPTQRSRSKSPGGANKYGPKPGSNKKRFGPSPSRDSPNSKTKRSGDARAATTSSPFTGGSLV